MQDTRILLIIGGGIAAYKSLELIRRLKERGMAVRAVLTRAGAEFVTPLSVATLSEEKAYTDLFDLKDEAEIGHIRLSREADLVVVAPATADLLAKMAAGIADDLATTLLLATDKRMLVAPAMNVRMWDHPATQRNVATLHADGVAFVGPNQGDMACGEYGFGRMAEPLEIVAAIETELGIEAPLLAGPHAELEAHAPKEGPLLGKHVLITSGPTHEPIDPVRYLANRSSGKQGLALARAALALGADVTFVTGPTALPLPAGIDAVRVETAREMMQAVEQAPPADIAIFAAAVGDWRAAAEAPQKLKKRPGRLPTLTLKENPDILTAVAKRGRDRPRLVIGFAAETENLLQNAEAKRRAKGADWIVGNDVSATSGVMGGDRNAVHLVTKSGTEEWTDASKDEVARRLMARAAAEIAEPRVAAE